MLSYKKKNDNYTKIRYSFVSIPNLMYKLYNTLNIKILHKSGNTNFNRFSVRHVLLKHVSASTTLIWSVSVKRLSPKSRGHNI